MGWNTVHLSVPPDSREFHPNGVFPEYGEANGIAHAMAQALEPLNVGPHCIQWALVEWGGQEHVARHPAPWASAIAHVVRGSAILARESSKFQLEVPTTHRQARVDFAQPTIFVKTNQLYLFDAVDGSLTKTSHLMLAQYHELDTGDQSLRVIDIVANGDIQAFAVPKGKEQLRGDRPSSRPNAA
ncbi:MAG: hypothetical protein ABSC94_29515 [Polyangiaceae bacterium]